MSIQHRREVGAGDLYIDLALYRGMLTMKLGDTPADERLAGLAPPAALSVEGPPARTAGRQAAPRSRSHGPELPAHHPRDAPGRPNASLTSRRPRGTAPR